MYANPRPPPPNSSAERRASAAPGILASSDAVWGGSTQPVCRFDIVRSVENRSRLRRDRVLVGACLDPSGSNASEAWACHADGSISSVEADENTSGAGRAQGASRCRRNGPVVRQVDLSLLSGARLRSGPGSAGVPPPGGGAGADLSDQQLEDAFEESRKDGIDMAPQPLRSMQVRAADRRPPPPHPAPRFQ